MAGGSLGPVPFFWRQPIRYMRWASHEKPALFWSVIIGCAGPVCMLVGPPIRRQLGYERAERIPMTYPSMFFVPAKAVCLC